MTSPLRTLAGLPATRIPPLPGPGPDPWDTPDPLNVGHIPDWARTDTPPAPTAADTNIRRAA